jgi:hypothetical protein
MSFAYSHTFALNVLAGYGVMGLGALLGLAAAVWWMRAGEWLRGGTPPAAFRALSTLAFLLFIIGIFWQLAGYLRIEYTRGWW